MAAAQRKQAPAMKSAAFSDLQARPWAYDIWQAMALLMIDNANACTTHIGASVGSAFAASPVKRVAKHGDTFFLELNLPGLAGAAGPLPLEWSALAQSQARQEAPALSDFWNIFHHSFFKQWYKRAIACFPELGPPDSAAPLPGGHPLADCLYAIAGALTAGQTGQQLATIGPGPLQPMPGQVPAVLFLAGAAHWGHYPRSAAGLERLVEMAFAVKCRVEQLQGAWDELPAQTRTRLGTSQGGNNRLGQNAMLGGHVFDAAAGIKLRLGPLSTEQHQSFLFPPAGSSRRGNLLALVKWYAGDNVQCAVELVVEGKKAKESF